MFKSILSSISFLTIIPISDKYLADSDLGESVKYFPIVGVIIGLIMVGLTFIYLQIFSSVVSAIIVVASFAIISGGIHYDGLADTADGLLSSRPKNIMLDIMHDSSIGVMGVLVLVFAIMLKCSLIYTLIINKKIVYPVIFLMPICGRVSQILNMCFIPYARSEGVGGIFWERASSNSIAAIAVLLLTSLITSIFSEEFNIFHGLLYTITVICFTYLWSKYCENKIGGGTGDTVGAWSELCELLILVITGIYYG